MARACSIGSMFSIFSIFSGLLVVLWICMGPGAALAQQDASRPPGEGDKRGGEGDKRDGEGDKRDGERDSDTWEVDRCPELPGLSDAMAESRAFEHYERGLKLYEQGDYRAAIEEFALAYCHKPNATVLKDIGQSFERLVDYEKAVVYLERYIMESPEDERERRRVQSARVQVLRNLPAQVRIATEPPGASVTLTSTSGARGAHGFSNAEDPLVVRKGSYVMSIELPGYEPVEKTIEVEIGQPYSYYYRLEPRKGSLRVATVPATARIFVDNRWVALGSYAETLPIGKYTVRVEAEERVSETREVEISEGNQTAVTVELAELPRSGRTELLLAATVGGGFMGSGLTSLLSDDGLAVGGAGPLGLALGFGGAYLAVPDDIPVGTSSYIIGVSVIGAVQGGLLGSYLSCGTVTGEDGTVTRKDNCDPTPVTAASLAGTVGGLLFSSLTASRLDLDAGDAGLINSGALWGGISGSLFWLVFESDPRIGEPLILGGMNLGILTGALLAKQVDISRAHAALIDVSGFLGLLVGGAIADVADQDQGISERIPHVALLGMTVGLITGTYLTRNMDEPAALKVVNPSVGAVIDASGENTPTMGLRGRF